MQNTLPGTLLCLTSFLCTAGCKLPWNRPPAVPTSRPELEIPTPDANFEVLAAFLGKSAGAVVLEGDPGSKVLVSPRLQGRLLTCKVGSVESTSFLDIATIVKGESDPRFNNFGGADRFWIYPEAGQFGLYFDPGTELDRKAWRVPLNLNKGSWTTTSGDASHLAMTRDLEVRNYMETQFNVQAERAVFVIQASSLPSELGVKLPEGVAFAGAATRNVLLNVGSRAWTLDGGLIGIWIVGTFKASDSTAIIAPFRPGTEKDLGHAFNDEYFGKVSVEAPERLKVVKNAVVMKADARHVSKFGISQQRTTGLAGAIDFGRSLLTIVKFTVPPVPERYGNSTWVKDQPEPFRGDAFQSYNHGPSETRSNAIAEAPFFELSSTSPVRPLQPGEAITHWHTTYHFQGQLTKLTTIARQILGVELVAVRDALRM